MEQELYHYGILGMKWGIRRYQNEDGSLTPEGRRRLANNAARVSKRERQLDRARWYKKNKARVKRDRALDRYDKFVKRLGYNTMSDEALEKAIKNFKANEAVSAVVTTKNVQKGERSLEDKLRLAQLTFSVGSSAVGLMSNIRKYNWDRQDRYSKQISDEDKDKNKNKK